MKIKTFILTFLMMMSSPFLFGQHWEDPGDTGYNQSMSLLARIFLDDDVQEGNYEVAAFYNDELLGVGQIVPLTGTTSNYHVHLNVQGNTTLDGIYFKFFNGTNEYVSSTEMSFTEGLKGSHSSYEPINFYSVAQIGDVVYPSLQKAINACKEGDNTIELLADNAEDVTIKQVEGVNVTIDGGTSRYGYSGTITIHGNARYQGEETLTFKNIDFTTNEAGHYFIDSNSTASAERYAHNVTVKDCNFTATDAGVNSAVAMRIRQGFDIAINGGTFTNLHSALQAYGNAGITVSGITLNGKNGISAGTSTGVVIENSNITATGYGVRADGTGAYEMTLEDNTISAELPVVVRKATGAYKLTVESGTYTALNSNPAVTFTTGDDGTFVAPTSPATADLADGISTFGFEAKIGTVYHTTFVNAYAAAAAGDVITLLKDQNFSEIITLDKAITLDGGNYKLTSTAGRAINVDCAGEVTIKNLTIVGSTGCERGINIIEQAGITNIENVTISGQSHYAVHMATSAGAATVNVKNSNLTGYGAFVVYGKGSVNTIENSTLVGINTYDDNGSNNFGTIVADVENTTITVTGGNITAKAEEGKAGMAIFTGKNGNNANVTLNSTLALEGAAKYIGILNETTTLKVKAEYATAIQAEGFATSDPDNGLVKVEGVAVAKIGETKYATLAKAITAAQANDVIVLLADITENVTVSKNLTIDGDEFAYTGTMTISNGKTVTVQNVNFVKGCIDKAKGTSGNLTVKNCNFDGVDNTIAYAVTMRGGNSVTIEGGEVKNYDYGMLYVPSAVSNVTVKDTEVDGVNYGVHVAYGSKVNIENVTMTNMAYGIMTQNYGAKTITIKNSSISGTNPIYVWERNTTVVDTFKFEGDNTLSTLTSSAQAKLVLAATDATLTAPAGYNVTSGVDNLEVIYKNGCYSLYGLSGSGTEGAPFLIFNLEDLKFFRDHVNAGKTRYNAENVYVALANDIDMVSEDWSVNIGDDCNYTFDGIFDGNGFTISNLNSTETAQKADGYVCTGLFGAIYGNAVIKNLTIENVNINTAEYTGNNAAAVVGFVYGVSGKTVTIDGVKVTGDINIDASGVYGVGAIVGYSYNQGTLNIKNCAVEANDESAITAVSGSGAIIGYCGGKATIEACSVQNIDITAKGLVGGIAGITENSVNKVLSGNTVKDVTLTATKTEWVNSTAIAVGTMDGNGLTVANTIFDNVNASRMVGSVYAEQPTYVVPAVEARIENKYYGTFDAALAAAQEGNTITVLAPVVITENKTYDLTGLSVDGENVYPIFRIQNGANVVVANGNISNDDYVFVLGASDSSSAGNLTIESGVYTGTTTVASVTKGLLTINGGEFKVNASEYGATYMINCIDANYNDDSANVEIYGGKFYGFNPEDNVAEGANTNFCAQGYAANEIETGVYEVVAGNVLNQTTGNKYATLQAAVSAAQQGNTIELLKDITEDVTVDKSLTIDGKNNTYTGKMKMTNKADITVKNVNFDGKGYNGYAIESRGAYYITVEDCTAKNYGYGFIQLASGNVLTTIKDVTVSNMNYGVKVDYSNEVVLENVDINCAVAAVLNSNYGTKTITIKDSYLSILGTWTRNNTIKTTYVFEGENSIDDFVIDAAIDNFKLADVNSTLAAPNEITVTTDMEGYEVEYKDGKYIVVANKVELVRDGESQGKYAKLQAAIDAAQANDVIVLLKDITENVTITKDLTIDGKAEGATANSKYTGTMTVNAKLNVTVQDIDFDKGCINDPGDAHGYLTIKNCNFDGVDKSIGYAVTVRGGDKLTIENSTAKNYSTGMLYIPSSVANIVIKDVEVSNVAAAFNITYSGDGTFENVKVDNVTYGIHFQIYGSRTYTVKNCDLKGATNPFWFWDKSNNTAKVTVVFEGDNDLGTKGITVNAGELQLATDATLTAAEGLNIKATEEGYVVEYNEGVYSVVPGNIALERNGEIVKKFATIQDAINAAENGDKVVVLKDVDLSTNQFVILDNSYNTYFKVEGKAVTIDLNGKTISGEYASSPMLVGLFSTDNNGHLTLEDSSDEKTGAVNVTTAEGYTVYSLIANYEPGCSITINGGTYKLDKAKDSHMYTGCNEGIIVNGGTFHLDNIGTGSNGQPWIFNAKGQNTAHVIVNGGTFNDDILHQFYPFEVMAQKEKALKYDADEGLWTMVDAVAYVDEQHKSGNWYTNEVGFVTLEEAFAAAAKYNHDDTYVTTVTLLANVELENTITVNAGKDVILDLNGKTITGKDKYASGSFNLFVNKGTFEIKDDSAEGTGKITLEATTNRAWNASSSIISNNAGTLTITSGALEHLGGTDMAYGIDNNSTSGLTTLNVNGGKIASPYRAIRQFQNSLQDNVVVVNGGTISARAGIWMQQPSTNDKAQLGTLTINDGSIFECVSNAVVIDICGGAQSNVTINGGTFSNTNENANLLLIWPLTDMNSVHENCSAVMNITGGNFTCAGEGNLIGILEGADTNGDVVLTGGIYSEDVNAYCAEGFAAVNNGNGTWTVMPVQKQSLVAGWNWYSSYLKIKSEDLLLALGTNGSAVVSDNGGGDAYYDEEFGWNNSLTENLDLSKMYMIETSIACDLNLAGELADASTITITLIPGWNWIGYPSNVETRISDAFSGSEFTPENGDVIKTKANSFAEYYAGQWYDGGVDMTMEPTKGYMYYNASNVTKTFTYNIVPVRGTNETIAETHYSVDYTKYPFNMTMVAVVDGAMNDNYEVAALVNGEVRGSTRPVYIESMDAYMLFLSINGDAVEEMTFKYYDLTTGEEYDLVNRIDYSNNAMIGSVNEPYVLSRGTTGIGDATMSQVNIYPNPTTTGTEINLQTVCDTVEVFNALGVKVAEYQNVDSIDALETAGIYVIRITNDGNVQNCRLVVK